MIKGNNLEIIAEIGSSHDGSLGNAIKLIEVASKTGFNSVKFQHHIFKDESLKDALNPPYFKQESREEYFNRIQFSLEDWTIVKKVCEQNKINLIVSPFSLMALDELIGLEIKNIKIASGEISNVQLIDSASKSAEYLYLSTGMSDYAEVKKTIELISSIRDQLNLFQCTSKYPCPPKYVGLNIIEEFKSFTSEFKEFKVGLSDHSLGSVASILSIGVGALIIEKHICFSNKMYGSDAANALEVVQLPNYINQLREAFEIKNAKSNKTISPELSEMRQIFCKKLIALNDIVKGSKINESNAGLRKTSKRSSSSPDYFESLGKTARKDIIKHELIEEGDLI